MKRNALIPITSYRAFYILLSLVILSLHSFAQTRPTSTESTNTNGICIGCSVSNPDNAWDANDASFATISLGAVGVGAYGEAVYGFADPIEVGHTMSFHLSVSGAQISLLPAEVFELFEVTLKDVSGNDLATYDESNLLDVHILNETTNYFRINIINEFALTQQVRIRAGNLLNLTLTGRDILLYDIQSNPVGDGDCTSVISIPIDIIELGNVLATINAPLEDNFNIILDEATIPPGAALIDDEIVVTTLEDLVAGVYNLEPIIIDVLGDMWECPVPINIRTDNEAVYTLMPAKNVDEYQLDEVIATVTDQDGDIEFTAFTSGVFPGGVVFATDGTMTINDPGVLVAGSYEIVMHTRDVEKGTTDHPMTIIFNEAGDTDIEAIYTVYDSKPVNEYKNSHILADVTDADGRITDANITQGSLPLGLLLLDSGTIVVDDYRRLSAATTPLTILTTDELGGTTSSLVTLVIDPISPSSLVTTALGLGVENLEDSRIDQCTSQLSFVLHLKNFSDSRLENLQVTSDLPSEMPSADIFEIASLFSNSGLAVNEAYDGKSNTNLLLGTDFLDPDESATIEYSLNVTPNGFEGEYIHRIWATAMYDTLQVIGEAFDLEGSSELDQIPDTITVAQININPIARFIPEGFSPNGDNIQDYFEIDVECEDMTKLTIYNRWGDVVYQSNSYNNDWDGRSNVGPDIGTALPDAVYYYLLELGRNNNVQGYVVIKR
jgi:gliding motility-associated-like protein